MSSPGVSSPRSIFENYVQDILVDDQVVELSLWDTADITAHLICVDNPISLENVESKWIDEILEHCPGVKVSPLFHEALAMLKSIYSWSSAISVTTEAFGNVYNDMEHTLWNMKRVLRSPDEYGPAGTSVSSSVLWQHGEIPHVSQNAAPSTTAVSQKFSTKLRASHSVRDQRALERVLV
ncbi:hypothetical protein H0H81_003375 [Sphagnurus paluster]|uniref:Uncharacterized protein n=1 Tax=Sphagnurus paluster TaxID=117069 RepID=A0A9P7FZK8_9AGAR|nr:hypothetical protein H0H81_003375 [Sphagnurus paluster]